MSCLIRSSMTFLVIWALSSIAVANTIQRDLQALSLQLLMNDEFIREQAQQDIEQAFPYQDVNIALPFLLEWLQSEFKDVIGFAIGMLLPIARAEAGEVNLEQWGTIIRNDVRIKRALENLLTTDTDASIRRSALQIRQIYYGLDVEFRQLLIEVWHAETNEQIKAEILPILALPHILTPQQRATYGEVYNIEMPSALSEGTLEIFHLAFMEPSKTIRSAMTVVISQLSSPKPLELLEIIAREMEKIVVEERDFILLQRYLNAFQSYNRGARIKYLHNFEQLLIKVSELRGSPGIDGTLLERFFASLSQEVQVLNSMLDLGDVNRDGKITAADALLSFKHSLGLTTLTGDQQDRADVNRDGNITPDDALCIFRKFLGVSSCLP